MKKDSGAQFILASASPRRKLLLEKAGYKFVVVPSDIDEFCDLSKDTDSVEHAKQLALAKAKSVAERNPACLVLGTDTVVDFDGRIIGKPADAADAERITRLLFSRAHKVITGVAIVKLDESVEIVKSATTIVYPKKITEEQIACHIESGNWAGKAGAYGIQETADKFVERIEGSFTNVMGLPMELVEGLLTKLGIEHGR